eukprot:CFRG4552T1
MLINEVSGLVDSSTSLPFTIVSSACLIGSLTTSSFTFTSASVHTLDTYIHSRTGTQTMSVVFVTVHDRLLTKTITPISGVGSVSENMDVGKGMDIVNAKVRNDTVLVVDSRKENDVEDKDRDKKVY